MNPADFILNTDYDSFKNNSIFNGSFTISGSVAGNGASTRTYTMPIGGTPDMVDFQFRGPDSLTGRPSTAWASNGTVTVPVNQGGFATQQPFGINARISGTNLVVTATTLNQTTSSYPITSAVTVYVRLVDYSIA